MGAPQRNSQCILASEAIAVATTDICKAFLQGVTYEGLAGLTREPIREVNVYLPSSSAHLLQQVTGLENLSPSLEVPHFDKTGAGSVDAPRCCSLKLSICTTQRCGMEASAIDPELRMLRTKQADGGLTLVCLKHVDYLNVTGEEKWILWVRI